MLEYKVITYDAGINVKFRVFRPRKQLHRKYDYAGLEEVLNQHAREGWRVVSCTPVNNNISGISSGEFMVATLERKRDDSSRP